MINVIYLYIYIWLTHFSTKSFLFCIFFCISLAERKVKKLAPAKKKKSFFFFNIVALCIHCSKWKIAELHVKLTLPVVKKQPKKQIFLTYSVMFTEWGLSLIFRFFLYFDFYSFYYFIENVIRNFFFSSVSIVVCR